mgnify:CR=1 FL=1
MMLVGGGLFVFCCGVSVPAIMLYKYKKEKADLLSKIDNGEIAPWEGEVLQGEEVGKTPGATKGYGQDVLDFYGNQ